MRAALAVACATALVLSAQPIRADDPADSWLVYALASANGSRVLSVNATWTVPSYPATRAGGNAPGWWFGVEPRPADVLIQPIVAYGDGSPEYTIFTGYYSWHNGDWVQSTTQTVKPGDVVLGTIEYQTGNVYKQCISLVGGRGKPICTQVTKTQTYGEVFTDVYFVVEHQPNSCSEYPANGQVTFTNIQIAWESGAKPIWEWHTFQPACNSAGKILNQSAVQFTWSTSD